MGPAPDEPGHAEDSCFDTSGVAVTALPELGGTSAVAQRHFAAGELVFRERALVIASAPTNLARVRAYCQLPGSAQPSLRQEYWSESPAVRCAATAACRPDAGPSGDSATEVLSALRAEGQAELSLQDVEEVIRVFNLNAYDDALAPVTCKVSHSCAPNVSVRVDRGAMAVEARACRPIHPGDVLSSWYFQDTGLWWMGADVRRAVFETQRGFACACDRCRAPDACRSLRCCACETGWCVPDGFAAGAQERAAPLAWRCSACGRSGVGDGVQLAAEAALAPRVLLELRPPKGHAAPTREELVALERDASQRLGARHWASAAAALVLHFRARAPGGALDAFSVACGCRFLGWLMDCALPTPPAAVVRTPISVAAECAEWLSGLRPAAAARGDGRCVAARLLSQFLLPVFDASGEAVAKVANTGARVEALRAWHSSLHTACGCCGAALAGEGAARALACGRCKQVRYCGRACQQSDWKARHRQGCLAAAESLAGAAAWELLAP